MTPAPGRECGDCSMCCKLPEIAELAKPAGVWCKNVAHGKGCKIYDERPGSCRAFHCWWQLDPQLGPEWKPDKSKFMIWRNGSGGWIISVDPGNPNAWRQPQYIRSLRLLAAQIAETGQPLLVFNRTKATCILPDRDVELPPLKDGQAIAVTMQNIAARTHYDVVILDPAPPAA